MEFKMKYKPFAAPMRMISALLAGGLVLANPATAQVTDISQKPLATGLSADIKPNVLFIIDDSGSMDWDYMPDHVHRIPGSLTTYCRDSAGALTRNCCPNGDTSYAGTNVTCTGDVSVTTNNNRPQSPFMAAEFNGMAYNPSTRYKPPVKADRSSYPSQTTWTAVANDAFGTTVSNSVNLVSGYPDTKWCNGTSCFRNGHYVMPGSFKSTSYTTFSAERGTGRNWLLLTEPGVTTTTTTDATSSLRAVPKIMGPHTYQIIPDEYCADPKLSDCKALAQASTTYKYPAPIRWCKTDADATKTTPDKGTCQAQRTPDFLALRYPGRYPRNNTVLGTSPMKAADPAVLTFTLSLSCATRVTGLSLSQRMSTPGSSTTGTLLLGSTSSNTNNASTMATDLATSINAGSHGYKAISSGAAITITAPLSEGDPGPLSLAFASASCGSSSPTAANMAFSAYVPALYAGSFNRVDIIPGRNSYPKGNDRSDCLGTTCTYSEEMTNFANWWTYYHTRMQAMKSATSLAFDGIDDKYRVGYLTISNSNLLNLRPFNSAQRSSWYSRLFNTDSNTGGGTGLRFSLSSTSRYYMGQFNNSNLPKYTNAAVLGETPEDPIQYGCQANYTILSTDGFWNDDNSKAVKEDGTTQVGNTDGALTPPKKDGNNASDSLADVAQYYASIDLRTTALGNCTSGSSSENVCGNGKSYELQKLKIYTLGVGGSGYMQFDPNYESQTSGDFYSVAKGLPPNASTGVCPWQTSGTCTWPTPVKETQTTIDDLWHAAVNGNGRYFSAKDPAQLVSGLQSTVDNLKNDAGAGSAASTSNPNVTAVERYIYVSSFKPPEWYGDLTAQSLDIKDGKVDNNKVWSAKDALDARTAARKIYYRNTTGVKGRAEFNWSNISTNTTLANYFSLSHITASGRALSQFCSSGATCLSSANQNSAAGQKLLEFIAGDRSNEGVAAENTKFFRKRDGVLGDIVNSEAAYVKVPKVGYSDAGFADHKTAVSSRRGVLYVGSNDGMLHAFAAEDANNDPKKGGEELWAFVPTAVFPNLYRLADKAYGTQHLSFVDGSPVVGEVFDTNANKWRTLLVGSLGAGGRAYFALDVTNPEDPEVLWEFTHNNLGLTMAPPEIVKRGDGTWVVVVSSGYNNVSPGDGKGYVFVLNAASGTLLNSYGTDKGSTSAPSGLGPLRAHVENPSANNTALRFYAGDNLGNLYRFNIDASLPSKQDRVKLLATLKDGSSLNLPQPITSRPAIGSVDKHFLVFVGTGRLLGSSDLSTNQKQSVYGIKDLLDDTDPKSFVDSPRSSSDFVKQTLTTGLTCPTDIKICDSADKTKVRTNANPAAVDLDVKSGWYVDLPESGERVNVDPVLVQGTLIVNSNIPDTTDECVVGGTSWANYFNYRTGGAVVNTKNVTSVALGNAWATKPAVVRLPDGTLVAITRLGNASTNVKNVPVVPSGASRFISWRELPSE
jgi:type IV pilus assembly protein PilY1